MKTARTLLCVVLACAVLATTVGGLSGCSSSRLPVQASPSATATSIRIRTIHDTKYGFTMAYPEGWVGTRYENPDPAGASEGTLLYVVAYANPKGAQANGSFLDSEQIAVYRVDERTAAGGLDREAASRLILDVILKDMATMSPRTSVQRVSVHGRPAWQLGYEYKVNGEVVSARSALMVKGTHAYWLTCQSETYSWRTVALTLDTVVKRFTLD